MNKTATHNENVRAIEQANRGQSAPDSYLDRLPTVNLTRLPVTSGAGCADKDDARTKRKVDLLSQTDPEQFLNNRTAQRKFKHDELIEENMEVGVMFASKPIVQAFVNPFVGAITNKIGYSIPMFAGFVIMFLSTLSMIRA
jgi:hypothetical protein